MTIFPIIIDSKPAYLGEADGSISLALLPYGQTTLLAHLSERLLAATRRRVLVLRTFDADHHYEEAIAAVGASDASMGIEQFTARVATFEPSDWLLLVDPRCFPGEGVDPSPLLEGLSETPRIARHLVALDWNSGGTNERVEFDAHGHVRRVQRYYDGVTWTVTAGVSCSLVPVSSLSMSTTLPFESLMAFRRELASQAAPSRDVPMSGPVFDLRTERGLLRLNERILLQHMSPVATRQQHALPAHLKGTRIHPSARLMGPVVVHDDVVIDEDVTVIGPTVIGARSHLHRGAVVAQSVVAAGTILPPGTVVRHRVVSDPLQNPGGQAHPSDSQGHDTDAEAVELHGEARAHSAYPVIKETIEAVLAGVSLVILTPLMLLIAALVKIESRGPVFYGDPREAKNGKLFRCYKFRTMFVGADAVQRDLMGTNQVDGPQFKLDRDPRVTRLGRWLRTLSLDELPQLINVALRQMSLVGPRPSPFRENQMCVPWREARLSVRPGITGLWQVCRHNRASGDFQQWIYYDIKYVRNMSFWVDLKILIATVLTLGGKGHVPLSWIISSHSREHV
jgi:lipopolysaccharide/colanic/teichoic acid biosynthesis glycosyltransferase